MSNVYCIGDLHFGHTHIHKFRTQFPSETVHRAYCMEKWIATIGKRDVVFVMGDAAFTQDGLNDIGLLAGRKILIRGNHDLLPTEAYLKVFEEVYASYLYKGCWLTHIPIHPSELYGRSNIHGHCHRGGPEEVHTCRSTIRGHHVGAKATYFNTAAEFLDPPYTPMKFQTIKEKINATISRSS